MFLWAWLFNAWKKSVITLFLKTVTPKKIKKGIFLKNASFAGGKILEKFDLIWVLK